MLRGGELVSKRESITTVLESLGGSESGVQHLVREIGTFLEGLNAELEGWKFVLEDFEDGTRVMARFQIIIRK